MTFTLREDDLSGPEIAALLAEHMAEMRADTPPESVHAMPLEALRAADVTVFTAWDDQALAGCGALKELDPTHGEIKSMRTSAAYRRRGVAERLLAAIEAEARSRGYRRLSLETGRPAAFAPAQALYRRHGYIECPPFADYREEPFSVYMTKAL